MQAIDNDVLAPFRRAKGTRHKKIDLGTLATGARIKVVSDDGIPFFLEVTDPRLGKVHLFCDSGSKKVREDIRNADLGQRLIYCFSRGNPTPSRNSIEEDNQLWFDTFLCFWVAELFLLE